MEQRDNPARSRINTGQVRAFPEITARTRQSQIARFIGAAMLAAYDVLDVMSQRTTLLRKETIFATIPGSGSNQYSRCRFHHSMASESCLLAFSFRIATKSSALISASYSARSSSLSNPSFARSASVSTLSCTEGETPSARMRRADSESRQRLSGSRNSSSTVEALTLLRYHVQIRPVRYHRARPTTPIRDCRRGTEG